MARRDMRRAIRADGARRSAGTDDDRRAVRGKTAVTIIVAGLLLMLLGIGQRTIWAPAETVTAGLAEGSR